MTYSESDFGRDVIVKVWLGFAITMTLNVIIQKQRNQSRFYNYWNRYHNYRGLTLLLEQIGRDDTIPIKVIICNQILYVQYIFLCINIDYVPRDDFRRVWPEAKLRLFLRFGPKLNNQSFCDSKNPDYMQRRSKRGALFGSIIFIFLLPYKCHSVRAFNFKVELFN